MTSVLWVFLGGGLGCLCRYGIGLLMIHSNFPFGTFVSNVISCFILGILIGLTSEEILRNQHKLFLMTGFCGGFSTFSTYSAEIVQLFQSGQVVNASIYLSASVAAGIACIIIGIALTRILSFQG